MDHTKPNLVTPNFKVLSNPDEPHPFYVAKGVLYPSGEGIQFWQQVSRYYGTKRGAINYMNKLLNKQNHDNNK